jgi:glycosyltransferase involved in cell wall biosynthesis
MRICMVANNMGTFGGLQEFAKNLAIGVKQQGHQVSVFSAAWDPPDNQYIRGLRQKNVTFVQLPKWVSVPSSDWPTKRRLQSISMWLSTPLIYILASILVVVRRQPWEQSLTSARNWMRQHLVSQFEPDERQPFIRFLLNWWRFWWKPDLIHIHGYTSDLLFVIDWAYSKKIPVVYEEHQTPDAQFDWWQDFKKSINKASVVVAVSEISAKALREVAGVTQPIEVAYYMVPDPMAAGWVADSRSGMSDEEIRISTPARLYITKGLTYLLDAIVQVKAFHPNVQFRVYGDGPLHEELLAYAEQLGLDGKQIFVGAFTSREELSQIMAKTDIFVLSSILEGLPIALLEAMSYGRPVVVTPVGGIPEAIEDGVNGLLCAPRDPECLAQKICCLIEDPGLRLKLGRAARKTYEQGPFNPIAVCNQHISIYQNILASKNGAN